MLSGRMSRSASTYGEYVAAILHIHLKLTNFSEAYSCRCSLVNTSFVAGIMREFAGPDNDQFYEKFSRYIRQYPVNSGVFYLFRCALPMDELDEWSLLCCLPRTFQLLVKV